MPGLDIHAGIWLALEEAGVVPTEVAGTSAGAIVSALQAAGRSASFAAALMNSLSDGDVRRERFAWKLRIPWIDSFMENDPILSILNRVLPGGFDKLALPFSAWATRVETGEAVNVANPEICPSVTLSALASMSISGVFPAVRLSDGFSYVDGGVRSNLPLPANWRDYDQVWLLIAQGRPADYQHRSGILTNLLRNVHYLMQDQLCDALETTAGDTRVHVVWPALRVTAGMLHFDHDLIMSAYRYTKTLTGNP